MPSTVQQTQSQHLAKAHRTSFATILGASLLLFAVAVVAIGFLIQEFNRIDETNGRRLQELAHREQLLQSLHHSALRLVLRRVFNPGAPPDSLRYQIDALTSEADRAHEQFAGGTDILPPEDVEQLAQSSVPYFLFVDSVARRLSTPWSKVDPWNPEIDSLWMLFTSQSRMLEAINSTGRDIRTDWLVKTQHQFRDIATTSIIGAALACGLIIGFVLLFASRWPLTETKPEPVHTLLEYSTSPVLVLGREGEVTYVNPAFERWSGSTHSELVRTKAFDNLRQTDASEESEKIWTKAFSSLSAGNAWSSEVEWSRKDGTNAVAAMVVSPVMEGGRMLVEAIALFTDLTERREYARRIRETQRQFQNIVESSLDGIVVVQDSQLFYANPTAVSIFGYASVAEMQTINISETVSASSRPFLSLRPEGRLIGDEILRNYELRGVTKQGKLIDLEVNARVIEWNGRPAVQASFRDITERKALEREQALWLWEQETLSDIDRKLVGIVNLQQILDSILQQTLNLTRAHWAGVLMIDETSTNAQWKAVKGNTQEFSSEQFLLPALMRKTFESKEPLILQEFGQGIRPSATGLPDMGDEGIVSAAIFPLMLESKARGLLTVGFRHFHDFAGREIRLLMSLAEKNSIALANAELYENLVERERELELLSGARVQAQEEERRRIAREIHDGLGQLLTAIKFNLEILEDSVNADDGERKRIDDMKSLLDDVMKEAREISYDLMPSVLVDFGLAPALQLLSEQFGKRHEIPITFQAHGLTERLDGKLEVGLYRIAQEALNNIGKHANATEVNVQIIRHAGGVGLMIEDNGRGMVQKQRSVHMTDKGGMGLVSMKERAATFAGILTIDSSPGHGTVINVEIPLKKDPRHE